MAESSFPVDLFNPGQVFACLGFLEAADVLLGDAEGGFDWSNKGDVDARFHLRARSEVNPFSVVLRFLVKAQVLRLAPAGYSDPRRKGSSEPEEKVKKRKGKKNGSANAEAGLEPAPDGSIVTMDEFPASEADPKNLPVRLETDGLRLDIGYWCDGSSRNDFKLYAGQQRAPVIVREMLQGIAALWRDHGDGLNVDPFRAIAMGGSSFKLDARKAWTGIDAGYSPDGQEHSVAGSPVVEILGAVGLEHARPEKYEEYEPPQVRYGVWRGLLPPILARPALAAARVGVPLRVFRFELHRAGQNKVVTFAQEEANV